MTATIKIKNSSTTGAVPTSSDLVQGELAVNVTDTGLYTENASGTVVKLNAPSIDDKNTGATKHLTISTGGNLGLGVAPSASWSGQSAFQVNSRSAFAGSSTFTAVSTNAIATTTGWGANYLANGTAALYTQSVSTGAHAWFTAASGTAGNAITFTQAMTLDASGRLGIGQTSPFAPLVVVGTDFSAYFTRTTTSSSEGVAIGGSSGIGRITSNGAIPLTLEINGNEKARIDSSGNLLVGNTSTSNVNSGGGFYVNTNSLQTYTMTSHVSGTTGGAPYAYFYLANAYLGQISQSGTTGVNFTSASDYRLKNIDGALTGYKERLAALQPKQGSWKSDGSEFRGFLAHEFAVSYPTSVVGEKDEVDGEGNPKYQSMQASSAEVIADLVALVQEQQSIITQLQADVAALKG